MDGGDCKGSLGRCAVDQRRESQPHPWIDFRKGLQRLCWPVVQVGVRWTLFARQRERFPWRSVGQWIRGSAQYRRFLESFLGLRSGTAHWQRAQSEGSQSCSWAGERCSFTLSCLICAVANPTSPTLGYRTSRAHSDRRTQLGRFLQRSLSGRCSSRTYHHRHARFGHRMRETPRRQRTRSESSAVLGGRHPSTWSPVGIFQLGRPDHARIVPLAVLRCYQSRALIGHVLLQPDQWELWMPE